MTHNQQGSNIWDNCTSDWASRLAERANLTLSANVGSTIVEADVFSFFPHRELTAENVTAIKLAWKRVRSMMHEKLRFPLGKRVLVLVDDNKPAKSIQLEIGENVISFPENLIEQDLPGLYHELAHSFRIYGRPLVDEGLAGLVECLSICDHDLTSQKRTANDIVLSGCYPASDHSLGLYVFAESFLRSGWTGVQRLLARSSELTDEELKTFYLGIADFKKG